MRFGFWVLNSVGARVLARRRAEFGSAGSRVRSPHPTTRNPKLGTRNPVLRSRNLPQGGRGRVVHAKVAHESEDTQPGAEPLAPNERNERNERNLKSRRNHGWTRMNPVRPSRNHSGVRGLVRALGRRLVAVECGKSSDSTGPLDAALLRRQVAKAAKAVTSHRTPNSTRLCAKFHHCSTDAQRVF